MDNMNALFSKQWKYGIVGKLIDTHHHLNIKGKFPSLVHYERIRSSDLSSPQSLVLNSNKRIHILVMLIIF